VGKCEEWNAFRLNYMYITRIYCCVCKCFKLPLSCALSGICALTVLCVLLLWFKQFQLSFGVQAVSTIGPCCTCIHSHAGIQHTCTHIYTHMHTHNTHTHSHAHTHAHTYTYTYTHTYIHGQYTSFVCVFADCRPRHRLAQSCRPRDGP